MKRVFLKFLIFIIFTFAIQSIALAQNALLIRIVDSESGKPVEFAEVGYLNSKMFYHADSTGIIKIKFGPTGKNKLTVYRYDYIKDTVDILFPLKKATEIVVRLSKDTSKTFDERLLKNMTVLVTNQFLKPIEGAILVVLNDEYRSWGTETDSNGLASLEKLPKAVLKIRISYIGCSNDSILVDNSNNLNSLIKIRLKETRLTTDVAVVEDAIVFSRSVFSEENLFYLNTMRFTVLNLNGRPIPNKSVRVINTNKAFTSDKNGALCVPDLLNGYYTFLLSQKYGKPVWFSLSLVNGKGYFVGPNIHDNIVIRDMDNIVLKINNMQIVFSPVYYFMY